MRGSEVHAPAGRLIVTPPGTNVLPDFGALLAFVTLVVPALTWVLARIDDGSYPDGTLIILVTTFAVTAAAAVALLVLLRAYRRSHPGEQLILDRRRDTVTLGDQRLCAVSELACIELRRFDRQKESPAYRVGLIVAGLRPAAAPRAAPSIFDDTIVLDESIDERAMRAYAGRIAAFAAVPVKEIG
jgi:hypothetical protein